MGNPVTHFDIGCRNRKKTAAFYAKTFGWVMQDAGNNTEVETGSGKGIDGAITALGHEPHNYVMVYIEVEDADVAAEKVTAAGGTVTIGPMDIPDGRGRFAWFEDPEGNLMGLFQPPAA